MKIGIIGAGNVGKALGGAWLKGGHDVFFSYSRDVQRLEAYAKALGPTARAGTPADAARFGEVVVLATPWPVVREALQAAGPLQGKIVIDCTNPLKADLSGLALGHTTSAAEEIARWAVGARIVKAFNTTGAENMGRPHFGSERASMLICGDDPAAKAAVAGLATDAGFDVVDAGRLASARLLEPLAMLWIHLAYAQGLGTGFAFKLLRR
ncbi:MAG TPA: NADPH-dependent F420 reductase [Candidatus Methylomirabilis sp.]|nr:NADPH-dependent F420 reductase [Candidatus Methylomirabilis sp.]